MIKIEHIVELSKEIYDCENLGVSSQLRFYRISHLHRLILKYFKQINHNKDHYLIKKKWFEIEKEISEYEQEFLSLSEND